MANRKTFGNILDTPLSPKLGLAVNKGANVAAKKTHEELLEREDALFQHYDLKRPYFVDLTTRKLIRKMATDMGIIGFKDLDDVPTPGRPNIWHRKEGALLLARVKLLSMKKPRLSEHRILDEVRERYEYKYPLADLNSRYYDILRNKKSYATFALRLIERLEKESPLSKEEKIKALESIIKELENQT